MSVVSAPAAVAVLVAGLAASAACQDQAAPMEAVALEDGSGAAAWQAEEATATTSDEYGLDGKPSLRFDVDVNYLTGEPDYPIGWPRMNRPVPEGLRDWRSFDFLELVIHSETSRDALPRTALGLILQTPDRAHQYDRTLTELRKGETTQIVIPLSEIPGRDDVTLIQFFISESDYRHLDTLDFYVARIALTRYTRPTVSGVKLRQAVAFDDTTAVGVGFRLLGLPEGGRALVHGRLRQGRKALGQAQAELTRGEQELWIPLTTRPRPGEAMLEVYLDRPQAVGRLRFLESPFAAEKGED